MQTYTITETVSYTITAEDYANAKLKTSNIVYTLIDGETGEHIYIDQYIDIDIQEDEDY